MQDCNGKRKQPFRLQHACRSHGGTGTYQQLSSEGTTRMRKNSFGPRSGRRRWEQNAKRPRSQAWKRLVDGFRSQSQDGNLFDGGAVPSTKEQGPGLSACVSPARCELLGPYSGGSAYAACAGVEEASRLVMALLHRAALNTLNGACAVCLGCILGICGVPCWLGFFSLLPGCFFSRHVRAWLRSHAVFR